MSTPQELFLKNQQLLAKQKELGGGQAAADGGQNYMSKEQRKQEKQLEIARQAGQIPAEKDEDGKDINPHMPKFITKAPWYLDTSKTSLKHQKWHEEKEKTKFDQWYARGQTGFQATKFRKGACENCGAMSHKTRDCTERPRKRGAKITGDDIKADEVVVDVEFDYAAKRDRYNGYNIDSYKNIIDEHEVYEELRKEQKKKELEKLQLEKDEKLQQEGGEEAQQQKAEELDSDSDMDYKQSAQEKESRNKVTSTNLRIREDRAVYLENLDVDSAYFDPKSRVMRDNPNPHLPEEQQNYKGLNHVRVSGEAGKIMQQEVFVWDKIQKEGIEIGSVSLPSATEQFFKQQKAKNTKEKEEKMKKYIEAYGGSEHFKSKEELKNFYENKKDEDQDMLSELEKERDLQMNIKSKNIQMKKSTSTSESMKASKYPEDSYIQGHSSIWGSWWNETLGWGYACCHATDKFEICEGEQAKKLATIREYHAKKAVEKKLKEYEQQQKLNEDNDEEEEVQQNEEEQAENEKQIEEEKQQKQESFQIPKSKKVVQQSEEQRGEELQKNKLNKEEEQQQDEKDQSSSGSSSDSSDSSDSSSSSDSDSDSSSSSSSSSSSQSSSDSEKAKKKKKNINNKKKSNKKEDEKEKKNKKNNNNKKKEKKLKSKNKEKLEKLDPKIVEEQIKMEKARKQQSILDRDDRKRKYNSQRSDVKYDHSKEEVEAYKMSKSLFDDPMNNYKNDVD